MVRLADPFIERDESTLPDTDFKPNLKNSVVFIYNWCLTVTTFYVNYLGAPFQLPLKENSKMYKTLNIMFILIILIVLDFMEPLRELMELVPFPNQDF